MHIQFGLGLQKLGALARRKFYPQEIDALLELAQNRFIKDSIRMEEDQHGFQKTQIDVDKIRGLIVSNTLIDAEYVSDTTGYREYQLALPDNYSYLIDNAWLSAKNCSTTVSSTSIPRYLFRVPIKNSAESANFYAIAKLEMVKSPDTDTLVNLVTDTQQQTGVAIYSSYNSKEEKFTVVNLMREIFKGKVDNNSLTLTSGYSIFGVFYERFENYYFPGELLVVSSSALWTPKITLDAVSTTVSSSISIPYIQDSSTESYSYDNGRLINSSKLSSVLTTKYYQPLTDSPVITIDKKRIKIYSHPNRIVNKGAISYIKKPQKIDVLLQRNCELAEEFHQKIVDMAVEFAAGRLEARPLTEITIADNRSNL